jgi:hypothetical protein
MNNHPEIVEVTDQVARFSAEHLVTWKQSVAAWGPETAAGFCAAIRSLRHTTLMQGRRAKLIGKYADGPLPGQPVLVFGEVPPGGGSFRAGTNQLLFKLDGSEYWRYPFTPGMRRRVEIVAPQ